MAHIPTPRKATVKNHFLNAQEVKDLSSGMVIDVGLAEQPVFDNGAWYFGSIQIWREGIYAEIIKAKKGKCLNCKTCKCPKK